MQKYNSKNHFKNRKGSRQKRGVPHFSQSGTSRSWGEGGIWGAEPVRSGSVRDLLTGEAPTILLSHSSVVYKEINPSQEVLALSGDTHGGQVWMPRWFWRLTRSKPDPDHMSGYFQDGSKSLVVTRGVGTSHARFRLGAPPEVVVFEFPGTTK